MSIYSDVVGLLQLKMRPMHHTEVTKELGYIFSKMVNSNIQFMRYHCKDSLFSTNHYGDMSLTKHGEFFNVNDAYATRSDVGTKRGTTWAKNAPSRIPVVGYEVVKLGMDILAVLATRRSRVSDICTMLKKDKKEVSQAISIINTRLSPFALGKALEAVIVPGSSSRDFMYKINEHGYSLLAKWDTITNIEDEEEASTKIKRFCDGFVSD